MLQTTLNTTLVFSSSFLLAAVCFALLRQVKRGADELTTHSHLLHMIESALGEIREINGKQGRMLRAQCELFESQNTLLREQVDWQNRLLSRRRFTLAIGEFNVAPRGGRQTETMVGSGPFRPDQILGHFSDPTGRPCNSDVFLVSLKVHGEEQMLSHHGTPLASLHHAVSELPGLGQGTAVTITLENRGELPARGGVVLSGIVPAVQGGAL
jgi:hypothetical protein